MKKKDPPLKKNQDRRRSTRYHVPYTAWKANISSNQLSQKAVCVDVSENGLGLELSRPLEPGDDVTIDIEPNKSESFSVKGVVAHSDPFSKQRVGIELICFTESLLRAIGDLSNSN